MPPTSDRSLRQASDLLATNPQAALEQVNELITERPHPAAFRLKAAALRALGQDREAELAEDDGIKTGGNQALASARQAQQAGQFLTAKSIAEDFLRKIQVT